jgi:integral membrane sensor domain MASE1
MIITTLHQYAFTYQGVFETVIGISFAMIMIYIICKGDGLSKQETKIRMLKMFWLFLLFAFCIYIVFTWIPRDI